jgi:Protein of unknown function (DUF1592)/Protein of unknown function (DUF1588)/Protein of unknown function (DUF1587)/Protein of unknown function (DUF1585)/Protein of unknown function (DUF1595)
MKQTHALAAIGAVLVGTVAVLAITSPTVKSATADTTAQSTTFPEHAVWAAWKTYCDSCHIGPKARGNVNLQQLDLANLDKNGAAWEKVLTKLRNKTMPPPGSPMPDEATFQSLIKSITAERDRVADVRPTPGRPTLHRLNRVEYGNAIRDLLGLDVDVAELLPPDDAGYGFDNIGDVLTVSPGLLERYLLAAGKISRAAVGDVRIPVSYQTYTVHHGLKQDDRMGDALPIGSRGGTIIEHRFPVDGEYEIQLELQRGRAQEIIGTGRERKLDLRVDDQSVQLFTIAARGRRADINTGVGQEAQAGAGYKVRIPVKAGTHTIAAAFQKDTVIPEGIVFKQRFDNIQSHFEGVGAVSVTGPYNVQGPGATPSREKIFICHPTGAAEEQACAEKIFTAIVHRAYRRPVAADDLPQLMALYKQGAETGGFESGVRLGLQKILVSPDFIFRMELDPAGSPAGSVRTVNDVELASRLSFFLWSSIPDDELLAVAERGELRKPGVLETQVKRMLADKRSESLVKNFAGQWLFLRNVPAVQPDPAAFPDWDENLRQAMGKETELWLESTLREDRSVVDLLNTDYTFVNQRLAEHYGIKGIYGNEFRRVAVQDPNRKGLLGQASIMSVTAYPNRTAPTIRGKWVLEQLLGTPPPPPPANVPFLKEDASHTKLSMRQRMTEHATSPSCAVCHKIMDPIGFALENFDGLGKWRELGGDSGTEPIDSAGTLPDGTAFDGPAGLRDVLLSRSDLFVENFIERLLTYSLGRGVEEYDRPIIRKIAREAAPQGNKWSAIILSIVQTKPFQMIQSRGA